MRTRRIAASLCIGASALLLGPSVRGQSSSSIELISATPAGVPAGAQQSLQPYLSSTGQQKITADNRYVVFASASSQLVAGDTNGFQDIFVRDRQTGTTTRVNLGPGGVQANGHSGAPVISANGRFVAFTSDATNLAPGDANGAPDVFVRDLVAGATSIVSVSSGGAAANFGAEGPTISADGRYIAFTSSSSTLIVPGDTNLFNYDVFLRDTVAGTTERISVRSDGAELRGDDSAQPSISADGRRVAFKMARNVLGGGTPTVPPTLPAGIYVRDLTTGQTILVSALPDGTPSTIFSDRPSISANGRYVSFESTDDLDPNFPDKIIESTPPLDGPYSDVFVRDLQTNSTSRVSLNFPGGPPIDESGGTSTISGDGRYVVYVNVGVARIRDRAAGTTILITAPGGVSPNGFTGSAAISEDAQLVYFESDAANLVANDTNGLNDAFVYRVGPSADLSLALSASTTQPAPNSNVTLTIAVTNGGPDDASGVAVRAPLPTGLTFVSAAGGTYNNGTGIWTIGALTKSSTATLQLVATFTASTAVTMIAQVSAASPGDPDSTPDNDVLTEDDEQSVVLAPAIADLSMTLQANTLQPPVGSNVTLTARLLNSGPGGATGVVGRMILPAGLTFNFANPPGAYDAPSGFWTPGPIGNGITATLTVVARVTAAAPIDVTAQVTGVDQADPDSTPNNNVATEDDQATVQLAPIVTGIVVNDATMSINGSDGKCTLVEAIIAANTDKPSGIALGECAGGNGADTIHLRALNVVKGFQNRDVYGVFGINNNDFGPSGLPTIVSDITIEGGADGAVIDRGGVDPYRLLTVDTTGRLTLDKVGVTRGLVTGTVDFDGYGGGILNQGALAVNGGYFLLNQARTGGGAIESLGPLVVRGSTFESNLVAGGSGGAIHTFYAGAVTVEGTTFHANSAPTASAGAIMMHGTTIGSIVDSVLDANTAQIEAGGLLMHNADANVSILNTRITNNIVGAGNGGGISNGRVDAASGAVIVPGGTMAISNSVIANNRVSAGWGAGVANAGGALTVTATTVSDNQMITARCGGGTYSILGVVTLNGSTIMRNAGGGGLCAVGGAVVSVNSTISLNSAIGAGGGVALFQVLSAAFTGTSIVGNVASFGAGLYSDASVTPSTLTLDNTLVQGNNASVSGGGLSITSGITTIGNNTRVIGNTAAAAGGGLVVQNPGACCPATVTMTGGVVEANASNAPLVSGGGGGIAYLDTHALSKLTLSGVAIRNNQAPTADGGGIFTRGRLIMNGGELRGNTATSGGGLGNGISGTLSGGEATLTDVVIEGNVATQYGGGIFIGSTVVGTALNLVSVAGGTIEGNRALNGGGVFVRPGAAVGIVNARVVGNSAAAVGGAADNEGGALSFYRATIAGNTAEFAGAVSVSGPTRIDYSTISGNTATRVGGIRVEAGAGASADLYNSTLSGNHATSTTAVSGGAFDVSGTLKLTSSTVADNVGSSGGINSDGAVVLDQTILAGNRRGDGLPWECNVLAGSSWAQQYSIIGQDGACFGALSATWTNRSIDPADVFVNLLGPLANNGGATLTHGLLPGSLAIDGGAPACLADDQRGQPRLVDGDGSGDARCDVGAVEQQTPLQAPVPTLTALVPASALAGGPALTVTATGTGFTPGSAVHWNGVPLATFVQEPKRLTFTIPASELITTADLATATVTLTNPGSGGSNALPFTIVSTKVISSQSQIVIPGTSSTVARIPTVPGQAGVSATMTNNTPGSGDAVVTVANYSAAPAGGTIFAAGGVFDVQVIGADASDSIAVRYYYPSTVTGATEASLQLQYWTGTAWAPVIGSGGAPPLKNTTDNLDGTVSGGRVAVTLDATSTPTIMSLSGTIFALVPAGTDVDPPVTTAAVSPPPNANGWNRTAVAVTLSANDAVSAVAGIEFSLDGSAWKPYVAALKISSEGIHALRYRARDTAGNVEPDRVTTVKIDRTAPLALALARPFLLWPPNGQLVDVDINMFAKDFLSGTDGFKLISIASNDPKQTAADVVGWAIGTADIDGQLRAKSAGRGRERLYFLTYEVVDRAGNTARTTATVVVPDLHW